MFLTERQKFILNDLMNEENSITAKSLAKKHGISVRTVRYDLDSIDYWLKEKGTSLLKVPRVGIKISDKSVITEYVQSMELEKKDILFTGSDRKNIILLNLILKRDPLISEKIANELNVSRSTIITLISELNEELSEYSIIIKGKTNFGYVLECREDDLRGYVRKVFIPFVVNNCRKKLFPFIHKILNKQVEIAAMDVVAILKSELNMRLDDNTLDILKIRVMFLIQRIQNHNFININVEESSKYKTIKIYTKAKKIYSFLNDKYKLEYEDGEITYLCNMVIIDYADLKFLEKEDFDDEKLRYVISKIVKSSFKYLNIQESQLESLRNELFSHLKMTLSRYELNIISENPILDQIKAKYGDTFKIVSKSCRIFKNEYEIELSDDEIGFVTMYFLKALEESKIRVKKNILIVCNTGRGASKLLATRVRNNIPEVNIKGVVSVLDIDKDKQLLKNVDLIIGTVKVNNVDKPSIVVSPIITAYQLNKIREFLYIGEMHSKEVKDKSYIDDQLNNIIQKYVSKKNTYKFYKEVKNLIGFYSDNFHRNSKEKEFFKQTEFIGLILVEISDMVLQLFPEGFNRNEFKKVCGIFIHIIMVIPHWLNGEYVKEKNVGEYEKTYPREFKIIEKTFNRINEKYNIQIKRSEVISILRYLI